MNDNPEQSDLNDLEPPAHRDFIGATVSLPCVYCETPTRNRGPDGHGRFDAPVCDDCLEDGAGVNP